MDIRILLVGNRSRSTLGTMTGLCREAGFCPEKSCSTIAELRNGFPHLYKDPQFREEALPVIIADASLPGLRQILGNTLPPVILVRSENSNPEAAAEGAFAEIGPEFPPAAVKSIIISAHAYSTLLHRFFRERRDGRETIDNLNEVIFSVNLQGNFIYTSSVIAKYGYDQKTVTGRPIFDYIHPEDRGRMAEKFTSLKAGNLSPSFFRILDGYGNVRHVRTSSRLVLRNGAPEYITGVLTDRTEESRREEEIIKLTQAVEQSANVIVITDLGGNIEFVNHAFEKATGYSRQEVLGKNPRMLKTDYLPAEVYRELWETIVSGNVWEGKFHNRRKDGSTYWEKALISPIRNESGSIINFIAIKEDISRELAYQNQLEKAKELAEETSRLKSEFLANMSHEIRTPLNVILGFTDLLLETIEESGEREKLSIIKDSGKSLLELINDILDFSKIEADKMTLEYEPFSLPSLLESLRIMFNLEADKKGLRFSLVREEEIPDRLIGDEFRIRQILLNLLSNAVKFTEKGSITLTCSRAGEDMYRLSVRDTGIGIAGDVREQIFKPFEQLDGTAKRKFRGTGLGLSITRRLVYMMGGTISLESELDAGSLFSITLPLKRGAAAETAGEAKDSPRMKPAAAGKRILVAEDNPMNQELMRLLLTRMGHECTVAENGLAALEQLERHSFDLVLLDMQMPVMDGMETIANIRKNPKTAAVPVIALTASAMKGDAERFMEAGCSDYLSKPIDRSLLEEKLAAL